MRSTKRRRSKVTDALDNYHGTKISTGASNLGEKNKGKGVLDPQEEYIFELVERDAKPVKSSQSKEDHDAGKEAPRKMSALLTWKEQKSGILIFQKFPIESLYWGNADGSMKSKVLVFLEDIGMPFARGQIPAWGSTFMNGMHIRARVVPKQRNGATVPDEYYFKEGSFRKYRID